MAKEGIYETHIPRPDLTAVLQNIDEEYAKQHPIIRDVLKKPLKINLAQEKKPRKRIRLSEKDRDDKIRSLAKGEPKKQTNDDDDDVKNKNNINVTNSTNIRHITDEEIDTNRLSDEELASLKTVVNSRQH